MAQRCRLLQSFFTVLFFIIEPFKFLCLLEFRFDLNIARLRKNAFLRAKTGGFVVEVSNLTTFTDRVSLPIAILRTYRVE